MIARLVCRLSGGHSWVLAVQDWPHTRGWFPWFADDPTLPHPHGIGCEECGRFIRAGFMQAG